MAWRKIEDTKLTAVADAIREQLNAQNSMMVDAMPQMIRDVKTGVVPDYWRSYLNTKATEINAALAAAGSKRSAFLWYTDAHWTENFARSPMMLKYLSKHTGMSKTFFGGDIAQDSSGEIDALTAWRELVADVPGHRSVIGNHDNQVTEFASAAERADFFIWHNSTEDMASGTDATNGKMYYYVDSHAENTRYICLSTGRMWTTSDEIPWCIETLSSTPSGWHIVIISHLWLNSDYADDGITLNTTPPDYAQSYLDLFDAYNYRRSGTTSFGSVAYDFAAAAAKIEFVIGGHIHKDYDFATATGIPVILTECDGRWERDSESVATTGTTTENCVYAIVADYAAKQVKVINVGRGHTRSLNIPDVVTYTNQLTKALALDGIGIYGEDYNGDGTPDGYRRGYRTNSSGGDTAATGWCTTGLIPAKVGDILRFKNMELMDISGDGGSTARAKFVGYDASFAKVSEGNAFSLSSPPSSAYNPVFGDNGDVIQVTIPTFGTVHTYIRICCGDLNENSIITVNEEID